MTAPQSFELIARLLDDSRGEPGGSASVDAARYIALAESAKVEQAAREFEFKWLREHVADGGGDGPVVEGHPPLIVPVVPRLVSILAGEIPCLAAYKAGRAVGASWLP